MNGHVEDQGEADQAGSQRDSDAHELATSHGEDRSHRDRSHEDERCGEADCREERQRHEDGAGDRQNGELRKTVGSPAAVVAAGSGERAGEDEEDRQSRKRRDEYDRGCHSHSFRLKDAGSALSVLAGRVRVPHGLLAVATGTVEATHAGGPTVEAAEQVLEVLHHVAEALHGDPALFHLRHESEESAELLGGVDADDVQRLPVPLGEGGTVETLLDLRDALVEATHPLGDVVEARVALGLVLLQLGEDGREVRPRLVRLLVLAGLGGGLRLRVDRFVVLRVLRLVRLGGRRVGGFGDGATARHAGDVVGQLGGALDERLHLRRRRVVGRAEDEAPGLFGEVVRELEVAHLLFQLGEQRTGVLHAQHLHVVARAVVQRLDEADVLLAQFTDGLPRHVDPFSQPGDPLAQGLQLVAQVVERGVVDRRHGNPFPRARPPVVPACQYGLAISYVLHAAKLQRGERKRVMHAALQRQQNCMYCNDLIC